MPRLTTARLRQHGNAIAEVIVAMLVFTPFIFAIPLLGKQLDIKQKSYDATRYSVWERTVWRDRGNSNRKSAEDITLEARDRTLGNPGDGFLPVGELRSQGVTENPLWLDYEQRRLLNYTDGAMPFSADHTSEREPVRVGFALVPTMAYEGGVIRAVARLTGLESLGMNDEAFAHTTLRLEVRPELRERARHPVSLNRAAASGATPEPLVQRAEGAILSDTWAAKDEADFRNRVDHLTVNEAIGFIELPARPIGALALGKGRILYGEGQFSWDPDLTPRSTQLPRAYVHRD